MHVDIEIKLYRHVDMEKTEYVKGGGEIQKGGRVADITRK